MRRPILGPWGGSGQSSRVKTLVHGRFWAGPPIVPQAARAGAVRGAGDARAPARGRPPGGQQPSLGSRRRPGEARARGLRLSGGAHEPRSRLRSRFPARGSGRCGPSTGTALFPSRRPLGLPGSSTAAGWSTSKACPTPRDRSASLAASPPAGRLVSIPSPAARPARPAGTASSRASRRSCGVSPRSRIPRWPRWSWTTSRRRPTSPSRPSRCPRGRVGSSGGRPPTSPPEAALPSALDPGRSTQPARLSLRRPGAARAARAGTPVARGPSARRRGSRRRARSRP